MKQKKFKINKDGIKEKSTNKITCYYNYTNKPITIILKIGSSEEKFEAYRNEDNLVCIINPKGFLEKAGYKINNYNDKKSKYYEIEKNNEKLNIKKVSCKEIKKTISYLLNNIYLGEFCEKTEFDFEKVDEKTYIVFNFEILKQLGLNWSDKKLETAFFIRKNLKNDFEKEFICGLIGNIVNEGNFGHFESSNYKTYPSNKKDYLRHMDNHHNYRNLASGKNIMDLGVEIFDKLNTKYRNECTGLDENERSCKSICTFTEKDFDIENNKCKPYSEKHKFGFGCVQWTAPNRLKAIVDAYKKLGNIKPSLQQCINTEITYIKYEFKNISQYKSIYDNWKNNTLSLSSQEKTKISTKEICFKYEVPADKENKLKNRERDALDWLNVVEKIV